MVLNPLSTANRRFVWLLCRCEDEKRGYHRYAPGVMHPKTEVVSGVCADEATALMKRFFAGKR